MTRFPVLEHHFPILECPFLLCPVFSRVPSRIFVVRAHPFLNFGCPVPSRPVARFLACPVVPLSRNNEGASGPLSQKVALSRPIGNPTTDCIISFRSLLAFSNYYKGLMPSSSMLAQEADTQQLVRRVI